MLALLMMFIAGSAANGDIRPLLGQQGFEGPINGREQISYVGHIRQGRNDYQIYLYHGVFRAAVVDHGVNKLIVIRNGSIFFGEYDVSYTTGCRVRGPNIICKTVEPGDDAIVAFTKRGPPAEILFDGEVHSFIFAGKLKRCNDHPCAALDRQ